MSSELYMLDFERDFLADVLRILGERLSHLHSHVDWEHPEESYLFDPMEPLAGVGVVAAQRYLVSVCNWLSKFHEQTALRDWLRPQKIVGVAAAAIVNAAPRNFTGSTLLK